MAGVVITSVVVWVVWVVVVLGVVFISVVVGGSIVVEGLVTIVVRGVGVVVVLSNCSSAKYHFRIIKSKN